ncbi:hypothetical protein RchiOBHm_Chr7g0237541 [Rosa chinensis]|uniref:Uncharacterized protein n=1 Tax=Rosa chinensis TaxID=74649 RepID=A0A2P6PH86_ROSCH|nr:hypothetical protein RchiOBHm_Chr7g0237541 [Rosa chinensis]
MYKGSDGNHSKFQPLSLPNSKKSANGGAYLEVQFFSPPSSTILNKLKTPQLPKGMKLLTLLSILGTILHYFDPCFKLGICLSS